MYENDPSDDNSIDDVRDSSNESEIFALSQGESKKEQTTLDRLAPQRVLDLYLDERKTDLADRTRRSHRYVIETFVEYCEDNNVTILADIDGRDLHEYRIERRETVNGNTLRSQLGVIRIFIRFAESIEAVRRGIAERIRLPEVERQSRDTRVTQAVAKEMLDHLATFNYASRDHALFRVLWTTAIRVGTARGLDVDDFDAEKQFLAVKHRPAADTPLKNGDRGERFDELKCSQSLAGI